MENFKNKPSDYFEYTINTFFDGIETIDIEVNSVVSVNMQFKDPTIEQADGDEGMFFIRPLIGGTIITIWEDDVINTFIDLQESLNICMHDGSYIKFER